MACQEILQYSVEKVTGPDHERGGDDLYKLQQRAAMPTDIAHASTILLSPPPMHPHTSTTDNRNTDRSGQCPYAILFTFLLLLHVIKTLLYKEGHRKLQYRQNRLDRRQPILFTSTSYMLSESFHDNSNRRDDSTLTKIMYLDGVTPRGSLTAEL